jgi:hypothetical protein
MNPYDEPEHVKIARRIWWRYVVGGMAICMLDFPIAMWMGRGLLFQLVGLVGLGIAAVGFVVGESVLRYDRQRWKKMH